MIKKLKNLLGSILSEPADKYSRLKEKNFHEIVRDEENRESRPGGLPVYINIETTRQCNLTCLFCPFHSSPDARKRYGVAKGKMELELFRSVVKQLFPTLKTCALSIAGEFTITPYLPEVFDSIGRYGVKFDGFTNAMLLTPDVSEMMMPHVECFTVSMDSPIEKTYETLRRGSTWNTVISNIRSMMAARERLKMNPRPRLDLQAVLMRSTVETLPELVKLAKSLGFDLIKGVHLGVFREDMVDESLLRHRDLYNRKREEAYEVARQVGIEILLPPPLKEVTVSLEQRGETMVGCDFLWRRSFINFDGTVLPCCAPIPPQVGNMTEDSFERIWRGEQYSSVRKRIFTDDPHPSCVRCWIRGANIPEGREEEYLFHLENY